MPHQRSRSLSLVDGTIESICYALVVYLPFHFGGVLAESALVLVLAGTVLAALSCARALLAKNDSVTSWIFVPVALFLGLVVLQIVPMPLGLAQVLAPEMLRVQTELLTDPPPVAGGALETIRLSLYPHASVLDLRILLALVAIFVAVLQVFRRPQPIMRLLGALSIAGSLVALLGIAQVVTEAKGIYWNYPGGNYRSGPFVHYGHYAQFLNLSIGASIALILLRMVRRRGEERFDAQSLARDLGMPGRGLDRWLVFSIALAIIAVAMSASRNGLISLGLAGAITVFAMHKTAFVRGVAWPAFALFLAAALALLGFGFDPVLERMETLGDLGEASADRLALLSDTMSQVSSFPVFGAGQGAFEYSFPMFDTTMRPGTAAHAENQYAEILADTGILGLALILSVAAIVVASIWRLARGESGWKRACAHGCGFGLLAVAIHAVTDFGLRIPAVAVPAALLAGLAVALAAREVVRPAMLARGVLVLSTLALVAGLGTSIPAALDGQQAAVEYRRAESLQREIARAKTMPAPEDFDKVAKAAARAHALAPGDIDYGFWSLAHAWRAAVVRDRKEAGIDDATSSGFRTSEALRAKASKLVPEFLALRPLAPSYGQLWSTAGQLAIRHLDDARGKAWIRRALTLAPQHPAVCLANAELARREDRDEDECAALFLRAMRMGIRWRQVLAMVLGDFDDLELARKVVAEQPTLLRDLSAHVKKFPQHAHASEEIEEAALAIWREQEKSGTKLAPWVYVLLARDAVKKKDEDSAIQYYRRFLTRNHTSLERVQLAKALTRKRQFKEAVRELETALRHHPLRKDVQKLLAETREKAILGQ